jgi:hypothetical protein
MVKRTKKQTKSKPKATSSSYEDNIKFVENVYKRLNIDPNTIQPSTPIHTQPSVLNDDNNNTKQCTICYQNIHISKLVSLKCKCKYTICNTCYTKWKRLKNKCPYCRSKLVNITPPTYDKISITQLTQYDWKNLSYMFSKHY